jgi:acid phosphatase
VTNSKDRLAKIKNTTMFFEDLKHDKLPQWMFITPNMTSDGHDTSVAVAGVWLKTFLEPLLTNKKFMDNTLVVITFDENETHTIQNKVFSVLIGDAVPKKLVGTTDTNFYDHYSEIATVEANWGLHTLGRFDVGANVFSFVAEKTRDKLQNWNTQYFFNTSYPGIFNSIATNWAPQPVPNTALECNGRSVLPSIKKYWKNKKGTYYKPNTVVIPDGAHPPLYT